MRLLFVTVPLVLMQAFAASAAPSRPLSEGDKEYTVHIATALTEMQAGSYESASQALAAAEEHRRDERLAYLVRAVGLIQAGAYGDAASAIDLARRMGAEDELCAYATAVLRLALRDFSGALAAVPSSGRWVKGADIAALRAYIDLMSSGRASLDPLPEADLRTVAMRAYAAVAAGDSTRASTLLGQLKPADGAMLDSGMIMSMNPAAPVLPMTSSPRAAPLSGKGAPGAGGSFSGIVTLRADRSKTPNADYVLYYVDDTLIGIINAFPFEAHWDTTRFANGIHTVRIKGETRNGAAAGETSTRVIVHNEAPTPGEALSGPAVDRLLDAVWQALRLQPSAAWAEYEKGRMAEASGNSDLAMLSYEKILAFQPLYRDVQERWKALARFAGRGPVWKGSGADGSVALTFDDGPNEGTRSLLAALEQAGVKATFFVVGSQARRDPEAVRAMASAGHEVACHSESHRSLTQMDEVELIRELFGPISVVHEVTGKVPRFFRPPGGHLDTAGRKIAASFGLTPVMWTNHCGPYEGGSSRTMEQYVASNVQPGSVVLMHNCEPTTLEALPGIVASLSHKGMKAVTISQLSK